MNADAILKASGQVEPFSEDKLRHSLRAARATEDAVDRVVTKLRRKLPASTDSRQVFRAAYRQLRKVQRPAAARYNLRRAMAQLGPTGYPFERLVQAVLETRGYRSRTSQILTGESGVRHEIDVLAEHETERVLVECKYRRNRERKCDVKISMYVSARARDLLGEMRGRTDEQFWLVTNTKFTTDAIRFAESTGLVVVGWDYPRNRGLKLFLDESGLLPLTCLSTLPRSHKRALLARGLVLCRDLARQPEILAHLSMSKQVRAAVQRELDEVLSTEEAPAATMPSKSAGNMQISK